MKVTKKATESKEKQDLILVNKPIEGFKDQKGEEVSTKDFIIQTLSSPGEKGLTTTEMRSRVFVINKLQSSEAISLTKEELTFVLQVIQSIKFPQIVMSILALEEEIASLIQPKEEVKS